MKTSGLLLFAMAFFTAQFSSNVCADAVKTIGATGSDYTTMKLAFDAINTGNLTGVVELQIKDNTTELTAATLFQSGYNSVSNYSSVKIYPILSNKTIAGNISGTILSLNGANNVTIDGRLHDASGALVGSTKDLSITNSMIAGGSMTIQIKTNASNNTVRYCLIKGAGNSNTLALITLSEPTPASPTGCANNTISNNTFSGVGSSRPWTVIYSQGITGALNTGNKILNNDFENCLVTAANNSCISVHTNNNAFTVSGNSFYETAAYATENQGTMYNFIYIGSGNSHTISNNNIGGTETLCGGGLFTKTSNANNTFRGIYFYSNDAAGAVSTIENNVIKNISWSNGTTSAPWTGISIENTNNVDVIGNTIGNINITNNATGSNIIGIFKSNGTTLRDIRNNFIYGINSSAASGGQLFGIRLTGGLSRISNNIIALNSGNTINIIGIYDSGAAGKTTQLYYNTVRIGGSPNSGTSQSWGLWSQGYLNTRDFRNNIFVNARSNSGATGKQYAVYFNYAEVNDLTLDYNDYFVSGTGGVLGRFAGNDVSSGHEIVLGKDVNSVNVNPGFANAVGTSPEDFKTSAPTLNGIYIPEITIEFFGQRTFPTMGAWEIFTTGIDNPQQENDAKYRVIIRTETGIFVPLFNQLIVELFNSSGILIDETMTNGAYTRDLTNGMYVIRINGISTKFIK